MPCTIVVGGQYGSEGKGKTVALTAGTLDEPWVVRCGGPNSGHTTTVRGEETVLRQVPAAADHPGALLFLSAGCAIDEDVLLSEVEALDIPRERIVVDCRAVLITERDKLEEGNLRSTIASTCTGTGAALAKRALRSDVRLASASERLRQRVRVEDVAPILHPHLDHGGHVIVEGTQGFGLSLLHGPHFPFVTSRDTTASGFAAEVGLSPRQVDSIIMVIRTFPIRVGGNSGPLQDEISWEEVQSISGAPCSIPEYTSVTNRLRRVAQFNIDAVKTACRYNRPTALAIMGLDRLDYGNHGLSNASDLTNKAVSFINFLKKETAVSVDLVGTGPRTSEAVWLTDSEPVTKPCSGSGQEELVTHNCQEERLNDSPPW
ncbi:MAG: adenylosuccinate synthetase [Planctomycetes bacterium]|nr:adenylosuccinate synthetase [Planctomycetota bacterium]